jgi:hypothetical protein
VALDLILGNTRRNWGRANSDAVGSLFLPDSQEKRLRAKVDDVRYDVRKIGNIVKISTLSLSAALAFLGLASIYRTSKGR